jgi:hypothetical protein
LVLLPGRAPSVATLGRWAQDAGARSGALLAVLDEWAGRRATQAVIDELYVSRPVLLAVEPDSLCWLSGRLAEALSGDAGKYPIAFAPPRA